MNTSQLAQLEKDLGEYRTILGLAADNILDNEVSKYPIFVAHQHELAIGVPLNENGIDAWNLHASTLEEFVAKQIILSDKIDPFRANYKDPKEYFCIFVVAEIGAKFVFIPRSKKK